MRPYRLTILSLVTFVYMYLVSPQQFSRRKLKFEVLLRLSNSDPFRELPRLFLSTENRNLKLFNEQSLVRPNSALPGLPATLLPISTGRAL